MKKKCLIILSTIFILSLMLPELALANTETVIHEQFGSGYYATWQGDKGTWDHGKPGSSQTTKPQKYTIPKKRLENAELTRVEVETGYSFDPEVYGQNDYTYPLIYLPSMRNGAINIQKSLFPGVPIGSTWPHISNTP